MLPFAPSFWTDLVLGLAGGACVALARIGAQIFPAPRAGLVLRESLALPLYATAAVLLARGGALPAGAAPVIAIVLALAGYRRLARAARLYILRK